MLSGSTSDLSADQLIVNQGIKRIGLIDTEVQGPHWTINSGAIKRLIPGRQTEGRSRYRLMMRMMRVMIREPSQRVDERESLSGDAGWRRAGRRPEGF